MNQIRKRVSIVIPAYNEERYLSLCLESIAAQTTAPYEVIVVDNNSQDATAALARSYPFVRVVSEAQQGIVYARNAGFNAVSGDIIARIDADTILPADWVAQITAFYDQPKHAKYVVTGGCSRFYNLHSGKFTSRTYNFVVHRINRLLLGHYFPWGSNGALPAEAWHAIRNDVCLRDDIHEDLDLGIHLERAGFSVTYRPHITVQAIARRITSNHEGLWAYLAMWPRTYRVHQAQKAALIWPVAIGVWLGSFSVVVSEKIANRITKKQY